MTKEVNKKVFFIWIWGIWMSALARFYKEKWFQVSWSDVEESSITKELISEWISVKIWHSAKNISWNEEKVFYTEAIPTANPELKKSKKLELNLLTYFEWVWEISKNYKTIAVAWAHWKSTTTAMIAILLQELWLSPSCIVWTKVPNFWNKNFLVWSWEFLIVEACEYRESFLNLNIFWEIILNIEAEHLDYYKTEENYLKAFSKFEDKIPDNGFLVWNKNCKNSKKIFTEKENAILENEKNFLRNRWKELAKNKFVSKRFFWLNQKNLDKLPNFQILWNHIKYDALCTITAVEKILLALDRNQENLELIFKIFWENRIRESHFLDWKKYFCWRWLKQKNLKILQKKFSWTWRRFENIWKFWESIVVSDYAHHPTEIKFTLESAAKKFPNKKIIAIFEPHQYSRTIELFDDFTKSFVNEKCELVIIPTIYEVRDKKSDLEKMSAEKLSDWINKISWNSKFIDWYEKTEEFLNIAYKSSDEYVLVFMWAWDIDLLARRILN
jgi:UDP-N-acetylmuramate--alanine ligase